MRVAKEYRFEAAHRLRFHEGACRNIHGHSYKVVVEVEGSPQSTGPATAMVLDFKRLSSIVKAIIDGDGSTIPFDHSIMLHVDDPLYEHLKALPLDADGYGLRIIGMTKEPTAEYIAELFAGIISSRLPGTITVSKVEVWETATSRAIWDAYEG